MIDYHQLATDHKIEYGADALSFFFYGQRHCNYFFNSGFYRMSVVDYKRTDEDIHLQVSIYLFENEFSITGAIDNDEKVYFHISNKDYLLDIMKEVDRIVNNHIISEALVA